MLLAFSAQATELVDSSRSGDSCCDDLTLEQVLGWSAGEPEMAAGALTASPEEIQERLRASQESLARFQRAQMQSQKAEESEAELLAIDRHEQLFERFDMSDSLASGENECACSCACDFSDHETVVGLALFGDLSHPLSWGYDLRRRWLARSGVRYCYY